MKKNDALSFMVYVAMLAGALSVGLIVLRPIFATDGANFGNLHPVALTLISLIIGVFLNAGLLELGHFIGAKIGKYRISYFAILGLGAKITKDGKKKMTFSSFDGLTGETRIVPKDIKTSNPKPFIYSPLFLFLIEVIALVACIALSGLSANAKELAWLKVSSIVVLTVGVMIFFYDIFPAQLDSTNDGYRMILLSNPKNKEAYNQILFANDCLLNGEAAPVFPVHEDVTDFTASLNNILLYEAIAEGDWKKAISISDLTIACKNKVSSHTYGDAVAMKVSLSLLFNEDREAAKNDFINLPLEAKKYIASLSSMACVRAYLLVSGLVEESSSECLVATGKRSLSLKKLSGTSLEAEKNLYNQSILLVSNLHPEWELPLPRELREVKEGEEEKTLEETEEAREGSAEDSNDKE